MMLSVGASHKYARDALRAPTARSFRAKEEVVQNKYKKIQGKKTKLLFLHAIS